MNQNRFYVPKLDLSKIEKDRMTYVAMLKEKAALLNEKYSPTAKDMLDYIKIKAVFEQKNIYPDIKYSQDYEVYLTMLILELKATKPIDYEKIYISEVLRDNRRTTKPKIKKGDQKYMEALLLTSKEYEAFPDDIDIQIKKFYVDEQIHAMEIFYSRQSDSYVANEATAEKEIMRRANSYQRIIDLLKQKVVLLRGKLSDNKCTPIERIDMQIDIFATNAEIFSKTKFMEGYIKRKDIKNQY